MGSRASVRKNGERANMTTPDHDESKPRRQWPTYVAVVIGLMLVVYPLSVGPAHVIMRRVENRFVRQTIDVTYTPLIKLAHASGTELFYASYIIWWVDVTQTSACGVAY
jgi:hypothetical protein